MTDTGSVVWTCPGCGRTIEVDSAYARQHHECSAFTIGFETYSGYRLNTFVFSRKGASDG